MPLTNGPRGHALFPFHYGIYLILSICPFNVQFSLATRQFFGSLRVRRKTSWPWLHIREIWLVRTRFSSGSTPCIKYIPVFRIPWHFGTDPDPRICTWLSDPALDPALFISDLQDANKNNFSPIFLCLFLFEGILLFTSFFKDKKS